jgi:hypothetical protein
MDETPVVLDIKNGKRTIHDRQKVKLESGSIQTVEFELPDLENGIWIGRITVEVIDDMPFDNQRHLAIMSAPQYRVLVLDGDPNETSFLGETHFLQSALRLAPDGASYNDSPYFPEISAGRESLVDFDVVLLANVAAIRDRDASRLRKFVEDGGGLICFCGDKTTRDGYAALKAEGLLPGEIVANRESFDLPWRIQEWDETHSIFSPFNDPQNGDLRRLGFRGITEVRPLNDKNVVATYNDGKPFVLERRVGDNGGSVLLVTTACDSQWSNWTQSELYLPIVHQMLGHLTGLNIGGPVQEELIDSKNQTTLTSSSPGVFEQYRSWQVVNVSPRESETERCSVDDFVNRFELNTGEEDRPVVVSRASLGSPLDLKQNEIWHWILFALVTVFIAEFFIANRTAA